MTSEKVLMGGDFNGPNGSDMGGFGGGQWGFRLGKQMMEGSDCWTGELRKG